MKPLTIPEGSYLDGVYVLTGPELRRLIARVRREVQQELARPEQQALYARQARRATWRRSGAKRYARYKLLCERFGEPCQKRWTVHLAALDVKAASC